MDSEYSGKGTVVSGTELSRIFSAYMPKLLQKQESEDAQT